MTKSVPKLEVQLPVRRALPTSVHRYRRLWSMSRRGYVLVTAAAFHCVKLVLAGRPAPVRRLHFYLCGRRSARRTVQDWRHGCGEQRPLGYTRFPFMNIDFASGDG